MPSKKRKGIAIITLVFVISIVIIAFVLALIFSLTAETRESGFRAKELQAKYIAEAGAERAIGRIQSSLEAMWISTRSVPLCLFWIASLEGQTILTSEALGSGAYTISIEAVSAVPIPNKYRVYISSTGVVNGVQSRVRVNAIFGFSTSSVFDSTYFINNKGWFWGGAEQFQGDVRANGEFSVHGAQRINGDVYAAGSVDESQGNFFYDTLDRYYQTASTRARPGDPAYPGGPTNSGGYDGFLDNYDASGDSRDPARPQLHANVQPVEMPYLGDLAYYQQAAITQNGKITQGGSTVVNNVHTGTLSLVGTTQNPIVINGPVVITQDVILKGVVQGQGTIYAGRNVHVIGDVSYKNPPSWPKPDYNPAQTDSQNLAKDFLGLCAKGNVILGNYTSSSWRNATLGYLQPPFTAGYEIDPTDSGIGYVSYYQDGKPYFNGNYAVNDGGKKSDGTNRKYYESSLSNAAFQNLNPSANISRIDALVYNNHAIAGIAQNMNFNGSMIARDEAITFSGYITMNYDYRARQYGHQYVDINLPISVSQPERGQWKRE